jgi:glycosyltransferase involved in cell wall biosynthesis
MVSKVYLNGRFLGQRLTGVQRYARETLLALDNLLASQPEGRRWSLDVLAPAGTQFPKLRAIGVQHVGPLQGHPWEQLSLPWAARDGLLWSFVPTGPVVAAAQSVTIHDATPRAVPYSFSWRFRTLYGLLLPHLARSAVQVMTVSEFSRGEVGRYYGADAKSLIVSGEGWQHAMRIAPDPSILEKHGLERGRYVLAVSSVTPHKNFAVLARAIGRLASSGTRMVIAGEINQRIFGAIDPESLRSVTHVGYVTDSELRTLYEHAGVFVYPSLYEGFGLPPLEAMAFGCPVITADVASMPEVCGDGALYFAPHDDEMLASQIRRLMTDGEEREHLIRRANEQLSRHSWESSARKHLGAIELTLSRLAQQSSTFRDRAARGPA